MDKKGGNVNNKKKIDTVFGLVAIVVLAVAVFVMNDSNTRLANDQKDHDATIGNLLQRKNDKIKMLSVQLTAKEKESENLHKALTNAKNDLEALTKKLAGASPVPAPAAAAK